MRGFYLGMVGLLLVLAGCSSEPQKKAIRLVSSGAVDFEMMESIRQFAQDQLNVPVRLDEAPRLAKAGDFQGLEKAVKKLKTDADVVLIAVAELGADSPHLKVYEESGIALINAAALQTDNALVFHRRIERQVMRAAAFSFGLPPTPDPFCVTRDYRSLEDLDSMGRNFSPPWQGRFTEEAAKRGLLPPESADESSIPIR